MDNEIVTGLENRSHRVRTGTFLLDFHRVPRTTTDRRALGVFAPQATQLDVFDAGGGADGAGGGDYGDSGAEARAVGDFDIGAALRRTKRDQIMTVQMGLNHLSEERG